MNSEGYTVGQLLDFIENKTSHAPNVDKCDCDMCKIHNAICGLSRLMVESSVRHETKL
jgi:hypothetical protein